MTTLVQQRNSNDCGMACIAMALGKSYEHVSTRFEIANPKAHEEVMTKGMQDCVFEMILASMGLLRGEDFKQLYFSHHYANLAFAQNAMWGRRSIMTVRSRNTPEGKHYIYWDGHEIFDPSMKEKYADFHLDCEPFRFWLFNEAKVSGAV